MENVIRAYSAIQVRAIDAERRRFTGWATTPSVDRMGDTVDPLGIKFRNPVTLLWRHNHALPVGSVKFLPPTANGIEFEAEMPVIAEEGPLKERVDTAWGEVKYGLARAVSIGFRPMKYAHRDDGGTDYLESEVYELSVVAIPAQADAVITSVKSLLTPEQVSVIRSFDSRRADGAVSLRPVNRSEPPRDMRGAVALIK